MPRKSHPDMVERGVSSNSNRTSSIPESALLFMKSSDILFPDVTEAEKNFVQVETVNDYQPVKLGLNSLYFDQLLQNDPQLELPAKSVEHGYLPLQHLDQPR